MSQEQIFDKIELYLKGKKIKYEVIVPNKAIKFGFGGLDCNWGKVNMLIIINDDRANCYASAPANIPEKSRANIAEAIARANYGLRAGNFEMDFDDGEIRYKTEIVQVELESEQFEERAREFIYRGVNIMDKYGDAFIKISLGFQSPKDAIAEVEDSKSDDDKKDE